MAQNKIIVNVKVKSQSQPQPQPQPTESLSDRLLAYKPKRSKIKGEVFDKFHEMIEYLSVEYGDNDIHNLISCIESFLQSRKTTTGQSFEDKIYDNIKHLKRNGVIIKRQQYVDFNSGEILSSRNKSCQVIDFLLYKGTKPKKLDDKNCVFLSAKHSLRERKHQDQLLAKHAHKYILFTAENTTGPNIIGSNDFSSLLNTLKDWSTNSL